MKPTTTRGKKKKHNTITTLNPQPTTPRKPTLSPTITCNPNQKKTNQTLSHAISTSQSQRRGWSQRWGRFPLRWLIGKERERGIREAMRVRKKRDHEEVKMKRDHVRKKKVESSWQRNKQERIDNQREERETKLKSIFTFLAFGTVPF